MSNALLAIIFFVIAICNGKVLDQMTSSSFQTHHSRTLLTLDSASAGSTSSWSSSSRPNIFISGNEDSDRPHGFEESRTFFASYNQDNNPESVNELRIVVIGDQGGHHHQPTREYINTARTIAQRHQTNPYHAIITTGDNIYNDGITASEFDTMDLLTKNIFQGLGLNNIPWFFVLGNHDHCLDPFAQVLYSKQQLMEHSHTPNGVNHPIVILPDFFYDVQFEFGANHKRIHMMMIDSMINRAEHDRYSGCTDHRVTPKDIIHKKMKYKEHLRNEQFSWMRKRLGLMGMPGVDYRIAVGHHVPFSTSKWRGCDYMRELLDSLPSEQSHDSVFDIFVGGHDHIFEFGWTTTPLLLNAVIGGTRSCDGVGWVNKIKDLLADIPTRRIFTAVRHSFRYEYWEYWWNVVLNDGWRGCEGGGFVELIFSEDPDRDLVATIIFYSGSGNELYRRNISTIIPTASDIVSSDQDTSFAVILKDGDLSRDTLQISEKDYSEWRRRKQTECNDISDTDFPGWLRQQEGELREQREDSIFFDDSEATHPDIHD